MRERESPRARPGEGRFPPAAVWIIAAALAAGGCSAGARRAGPAPVPVAVAEMDAGAREVVVTGALVPAATVRVAPKVVGRVAEVAVEEGQTVRAGQALFRLDTADLEEQVRQAEASRRRAMDAIGQARVAYEAARTNLERVAGLFAAGAVSAQVYDQARTQLDLARAQYESAKGGGLAQADAALRLAMNQLASAEVTAPTDGVVAARSVQVGEMVSPGIPAVTLVRLDTVTLTGSVEEVAVGSLRVGQQAVVKVDALPGRTFRGRVESVAPVASGPGGHFPVRVAVENREGLLRGGMVARAVLRLSPSSAVLVPEGAVVRRGGDTFVLVIRDGRVARRAVGLGRSRGGRVEVLSGLAAGERVVAAGAAALEEGQVVAEVR